MLTPGDEVVADVDTADIYGFPVNGSIPNTPNLR